MYDLAVLIDRLLSLVSPKAIFHHNKNILITPSPCLAKLLVINRAC